MAKSNRKSSQKRKSSNRRRRPQAPPPAPRGFYRGPLPLPGRAPVPLNKYRQASVEACQVKHRDQARDKYVLARNRRAQMMAGYVPVQPEYYPVEAPPQPLMIAAPPVQYAPSVQYAPQQYVAAPQQYPYGFGY
eukprot:NODE_7893_length_735_cov_193.392157_g7642_i0.p1 GENE.NODE_7893_length_735_cov_193.392157_g7642_i0~~NODE_7893_length_735_cov_193.392157_g7642_i0.p1  ORF type:complete len:151 (-),score=38.28 NODE_7893_length_735_cov_193.392157_g7642_i0:282-683(-)